MKRILSLILIFALVFGLAISVQGAGSSRPVAVDLKSRDDFGWGINIHHRGYAAYPEAMLEQHINLVAKSGSDWIRLNGSMPSDNDWTYLDTVVGLANKYGLKIVMVVEPPKDMGLDYITLYCKVMAKRYNGEDGRGFVDVFQFWNEVDLPLLKDKYGDGAPSGSSPDDYYTIPVDDAADLPEYLEYFKAAKKGLEEAGGKSKLMVNFASTHWGMIKYYLDNGLKIDVIGWDQYTVDPYDLELSAKTIKQSCNNFYNDVIEKHNVPVMVAETNLHMGFVNQEDRENPTLDTYAALVDMLYIFHNESWIKGVILYELLDEVTHGTDNQEAWFGLIKCDRTGAIGEPKAIYTEYQRLLGGNNDLAVVNRSEINLKPYEALIVDTADDSNLKDEDDTSDFIDTLPEDDYDDSDVIIDDETDDVVIEDVDTEEEVKTEEVIIENIITPVKTVKAKEITKKTPWKLGIGIAAAMLLIPAAYITIYILIKKKKLSK